ncbi:hypothetical protein PsorP6_006232 [Peronosclerospora sorghi]|uniref:Uncharacterized protein n=1 Tax=Peronosclerospora sorghi TaxID=230839 RepID=A0ACC0W5C7_9STRA|nr:hypothetical protein PsorP6_006232 [Peronosclerospora sorghi]
MAKLGLTPLLEAVEKVRPSVTEISMPCNGRSSPLNREALPSIMYAMGGLLFVTEAMPMQARIGFDINLDEQASCSSHDHMLCHAMI